MSSGMVFLVDDDAAVLRALTEVLEDEGLEVISFSTAGAFLAACDSKTSGCIVLDVRLPDMDGLQVQGELNSRDIRIPVIFLTGHGEVPVSVRAMKAGAYDFLQKPVAADSLLARVYGALRMNERDRRERAKIDAARDRLDRLSSREKSVLALLLRGETNKQVAKKLGLSPRTIEIHRKNILAKTGSANLLELGELNHRAKAT